MKRSITLGEMAEKIFQQISNQGEISEVDLIQFLEFRGIMTYWTYLRTKNDLLARIQKMHPEIKYNKKEKILYVGLLDNSLSSLSLVDKENNK